MSPCSCCERAEPPRETTPRRSRLGGIRRRAGGFVSWALPALGLALVPKCPFCVAGYVALWSGLGISLTTATYLRTGLIVVCVAALVIAAFVQARRVLRVVRFSHLP